MMITALGGSEDHLEAFMNGFEFVLLAVEGRLAEDNLPPEERARIELFLEDYWRIARAYRNRRPEKTSASLALPIQGPFRAEVIGTASN